MYRVSKLSMLFLVGGIAWAQVKADAGAPSFEVASIKVDKAGAATGMDPSPGGLRITNFTLKQLIEAAYHLPSGEVAGLTEWMDSERYDINAKTSAPSTFDEELLMLRPLLADRFHLQFHRETRQVNGFALVTAKSGLKLLASKDDGDKATISIRPTAIVGTKVSLKYLVTILSGQLKVPVSDDTGISGVYDIALKFAREDSPAAAAGTPTVFGALEEVGLKLEARKIAASILVVDSAERPGAN